MKYKGKFFLKKKIIIAVAIVLALGGAFFFAEKPPEKIMETSVLESSFTEVSEKSVEESREISKISVEESKEISEISVEKVSEVSEKSVEEVSEVSEISVEEVSEVSEKSVEEVSEVSEISVEEVSEISEMSVEEVSEVSEISVEEVSEISEISVEEVSEISEISENKTACTISISCQTLLNNLDRVKKNKLSVIPSDAWILKAVNAEFSEGESVFDVTKRVCMENKIPFEFTLAPIYNTAYIEGINNIYEFDCGSTSGWLYKVNGEFMSYGCSDCKLSDGDVIEWVYTCDLGKDVGNEYKE